MENHQKFMREAIKEAKTSLIESGIPIGAVLAKNGEVISRGHNKLLQDNSVILHGEMDCIENAGRLNEQDYQKTTLYTTLSPCDMCSGMILLYKIPEVVIGENETLKGPEKYLIENGVKLINLNMDECKAMMNEYIKENPETWKKELKRVGF
ncbi:MAG: nucleoside deaminase [Methanobacterium sp.]